MEKTVTLKLQKLHQRKLFFLNADLVKSELKSSHPVKSKSVSSIACRVEVT